MKNYISAVLIIFFIYSCDNKDKIENSEKNRISLYDDFENVKLKDSLIKKIHKGDTIAYRKLKEIYYLTGNQNEFFFYSFYMAKNFKYIRAYDDCYSNLKYEYDDKNDILLNKTTEYFLLKKYENLPNESKTDIIDFYGKNQNIPKSNTLIK